MKQCIVEIQCFRGNYDEFIIKELVMIDVSTNVPYNFLFKPPFHNALLNRKASKTNYYLTDKFHRITWNEGFVSYKELPQIMTQFCNRFDQFFTKGSEKATWIRRFTDKPVTDYDFFKRSQVTETCECFAVSNPDHQQNCALVNGMKLRAQLRTSHLDATL